MGNTKFIWFEGYAKRESAEAFQEATLADKASASYVAVTVDLKGYLGRNDSEDGEIYVIGIIHTSSMSGALVIDYHLKPHLTSGTIGYLDVDYPAMRIETLCEDEQWHIVEKREGRDLPRLGLFA